MCATFGSDRRMCSLMACRALWIFPSCTAFCTACDGATASTSALRVCDETPPGCRGAPDVAGGGTFVDDPAIEGDGRLGRGGGGVDGAGPAGVRGDAIL